jgi:hypothetical protein
VTRCDDVPEQDNGERKASTFHDFVAAHTGFRGFSGITAPQVCPIIHTLTDH